MRILPQTDKDILLRDELEEVLKSHSDQLNLSYTLDKPPQGKTIVFHNDKEKATGLSCCSSLVWYSMQMKLRLIVCPGTR